MQSSIELVGYSYTNALLVQMPIHATHTSIFGHDMGIIAMLLIIQCVSEQTLETLLESSDHLLCNVYPFISPQ